MTMLSDFHVYFGREALTARPVLRKLAPRDCFAALAEGFDDFRAMPSHVAFLGAVYALGGVAIASMGSFANALELVFPFAAGFALVGPFLAIGLYEMSRRREMGRAVDWRDAFAVLRSPALPAIAALGVALFVIFAWWIVAAEAIYVWLYGSEAPASAATFFADVLTTGRGWTLIVVGDLVGFVFAATALCLSVVSFPLLLDRDVGLVAAASTSLRLARDNPQAVALWGLIVAALLAIGSAPLFAGLAVVLPILGHATWRLYRRAVVREPAREQPVEWPRGQSRRSPHYHTTPHAFLFPWPDA
jgi:uncharacterized membrane protein